VVLPARERQQEPPAHPLVGAYHDEDNRRTQSAATRDGFRES
jgi:hypothetical protein